MSSLELAMHADGFNCIITKMAARSRQKFPGNNWIKIGPLRLKFDGATGRIIAPQKTFSVINPAVGRARGYLKEIDWKWDRLAVNVGLDIPKIKIGGWCLLKVAGACIIKLPEKSFFETDPDINIQFDFAGLRHEISTAFDIDVQHNPANKTFDLLLKPQMPLDVDLLDVADMAGDFLDFLVKTLVDRIFKILPDWAKSIVNAILGGIVKLVRKLLDIGDDLSEWISEKIGVSLGIFNMVASTLLALFFKPTSIFSLADPYVILPGKNDEPKVIMDISNVNVMFDNNEQSMKISILF
ncbi:TPA: hypothetical protein ACXR0I_002946 [Klebsiella variicola subsp. variicola]|uniref:hypothetical protein n=1 Tax=Klebsiella variicola TaxID=244366 RepID=UPI00125AFF1E|nr:hypothetical protein [Klebsiella variicola]EIX9042397.1 hypothetical protein [Klebsiella variicola]EIY5153317.1 hypothetical protein [Klebsiella variicola]MCB8424675.1 hypothetical protein [Klebsiella variicola subsp. variicola]MCB8445269.1 hypothetical protein [Klebsiella variicola subsp. variicola]MCB8498790.1 hypothetical protein [Klebsiella variicola subsp. variicola]